MNKKEKVFLILAAILIAGFSGYRSLGLLHSESNHNDVIEDQNVSDTAEKVDSITETKNQEKNAGNEAQKNNRRIKTEKAPAEQKNQEKKDLGIVPSELMAKIKQINELQDRELWSLRTRNRENRAETEVRKFKDGYELRYRRHGSGRLEARIDEEGNIMRLHTCGPKRQQFEGEEREVVMQEIVDAVLEEAQNRGGSKASSNSDKSRRGRKRN